MLFMTLAVVTVLCLFLPLTRLYGVMGAVITLYFYPYYTLTLIGVLVLGGIAYLFYNHRRKRNAV
jgi:hypothetical protein